MPTHCRVKFVTVVSADVNCDALCDLVPFVQFKGIQEKWDPGP